MVDHRPGFGNPYQNGPFGGPDSNNPPIAPWVNPVRGMDPYGSLLGPGGIQNATTPLEVTQQARAAADRARSVAEWRRQEIQRALNARLGRPGHTGTSPVPDVQTHEREKAGKSSFWERNPFVQWITIALACVGVWHLGFKNIVRQGAEKITAHHKGRPPERD